ncbi:hypothetical protein MVG78_18575 [Roseomonas gilardii subsp. gilardii]|uniref:hypothetical protein n=1 Tax=Roseomonas gilardii TaxID=257708 RepID=UPI001FF6FD7A|nr:hypothetical protein [Roseomonas gilardii]UPG72462.1 hypothetical protein MVG78_18575 [Roseomonas gilardii subsp. gilardii]
MFRPSPSTRTRQRNPGRPTAVAAALAATALLPLAAPRPAGAAPACQVVRFERGQNGTEIAGMAPPRDMLCYTLTTAPNRTASFRLAASPNVVLDVPGIAEDRREVTFRTERRTYQIRVGQLARGAYAEPFRLSISLD